MRAVLDTSNIVSTKDTAEDTMTAEDAFITGHPAYQTLYAHDITNSVNFALFAKPLLIDDLVKNKSYVNAISANEPGPAVNYKELPRTIRDIRLATGKSKDPTSGFLEQLLELHNEWQDSSSKLHTTISSNAIYQAHLCPAVPLLQHLLTHGQRLLPPPILTYTTRSGNRHVFCCS